MNTYDNCFQIRLGGAKGMISLCKELNPEESIICLRESQIKFDSENYVLMVVRGANFKQGHLNRDVILQLCRDGYDDSVVKSIFEKNLDSLRLDSNVNLHKMTDKSLLHYFE